MLVIPGEGRFPTLRLDDIESCIEKLSNDQFADKPFVFDFSLPPSRAPSFVS